MSVQTFRPGASLRSLDPAILPGVLLHPRQLWARDRIEGLIDLLRAAQTAEELMDLQRELFDAAYFVDDRRAAATRVAKRLRNGRPLPRDAPEPPMWGDPNTAESWELDVVIHERVFRQFRSVGDGLAWRVFSYNRQAIMALAQNKSPGPLVKRTGTADDDSTGLAAELGAVEQHFKERGHFALMHDLTNCLRIGDLTEVERNGSLKLHEVKRAGGTLPPAQRKRIEHAIRCANGDMRLRADRQTRLVQVSVHYRTALSALSDLIDLAYVHGTRGMKLSSGRALVATSIPDMVERGLTNDGIDRIGRARGSAIRRAEIGNAYHHVSARSSDLASRSTGMVPWAIYPFSAPVCADLTCDLVSFETILSADSLVELCRQRHLDALTDLPETNDELRPSDTVIRIRFGDRLIRVHPGAISMLLFELLEPSIWADGIAEMLSLPLLFGDPLVRFADDGAEWLPKLP